MRKYLAATAVLCALATPTQALALSLRDIDCAVVRRLTVAERLYWIARYGLTAAHVAAIKKHCNA